MRIPAMVALAVAASALAGLLVVGVSGYFYMGDGWDLAWPGEATTETATAGGALPVGGAVLVAAALLGLPGAAIAALFYLRTRTCGRPSAPARRGPFLGQAGKT